MYGIIRIKSVPNRISGKPKSEGENGMEEARRIVLDTSAVKKDLLREIRVSLASIFALVFLLMLLCLLAYGTSRIFGHIVLALLVIAFGGILVELLVRVVSIKRERFRIERVRLTSFGEAPGRQSYRKKTTLCFGNGSECTSAENYVSIPSCQVGDEFYAVSYSFAPKRVIALYSVRTYICEEEKDKGNA